MKALLKSLSEFQNECPIIHKSKEGYGYSFADLSKITQTIQPLLHKHGLCYTQPMVGKTLTTKLFHIETGECIESSVDLMEGVKLAKMNDFQVLGSQITYLRRYAISSILGLVTDADIDAAGEQEKPEYNEQMAFDIANASAEGLKAIHKANNHLHSNKEFMKALTKRKNELS